MWGVPVDHQMFEDISSKQWLWYFYNFLKDEDESFESNRDFVEYHASFIEPQAVKKIREARRGEDRDTIEVDDDTFKDTLKNVFGKGLDFDEAKENVKVQEAEGLDKALKSIKADNDMLKPEFWSKLER
jgi:hypothetical protein